MKKKLLVEGNDDRHVVWNLLEQHAFPETFSVEEKGGIEKLLSSFPVHAKGSGIEAVAVVVDADVDATRRWDAIRNSLINLGFDNCPEEFPEDGLVLDKEGKPRAGAWIMPDNRLSGMLEDFVSYLVPKDDKVWPHVLDTVANMPENIIEFSEQHKCKAHIHTWLAWKADPGTPMGLAITKKYLDANSPSTKPFLDWLSRMFVH